MPAGADDADHCLRRRLQSELVFFEAQTSECLLSTAAAHVRSAGHLARLIPVRERKSADSALVTRRALKNLNYQPPEHTLSVSGSRLLSPSSQRTAVDSRFRGRKPHCTAIHVRPVF